MRITKYILLAIVAYVVFAFGSDITVRLLAMAATSAFLVWKALESSRMNDIVQNGNLPVREVKISPTSAEGPNLTAPRDIPSGGGEILEMSGFRALQSDGKSLDDLMNRIKEDEV